MIEILEKVSDQIQMSAIVRHIKEWFGQGPSKAKLQKEFFLMEQKNPPENYHPICRKG